MTKSCPKCSGLMVAEQFLEFYGPSTGWKCINCGWLRTVPCGLTAPIKPRASRTGTLLRECREDSMRQ